MKILVLFSLLTGLIASHSLLLLEKPAPPAPVACKMSNGQNRPFPEVTTVKMVDVSPKVPKFPSLPIQVSFPLQLNYTTGSGATIVAPVQYLQIKNPITFTKFPASINQYRDRAEAWIAFKTFVDMTN